VDSELTWKAEPGGFADRLDVDVREKLGPEEAEGGIAIPEMRRDRLGQAAHPVLRLEPLVPGEHRPGWRSQFRAASRSDGYNQGPGT
jgi:hypothetical protein